MSYNLTENQKNLIGWFVQQVRNGTLPEEFTVTWVKGGRGFEFIKFEGDANDIPELTRGMLEALAKEEMLLIDIKINTSSSGYQYKSSRRCTLLQKAYEAVDNNFQTPPPQGDTQVTIGAIIQTMSGGNVQAIGNAPDSTISQAINDPDLLQAHIEALTENLLNEVRTALQVDDLAKYLQSIQDLRERLTTDKPDPSLIKRLIGTLGFLGDIEGTIDLMTRVWPILYPLLLIVASRFGK